MLNDPLPIQHCIFVNWDYLECVDMITVIMALSARLDGNYMGSNELVLCSFMLSVELLAYAGIIWSVGL